MSSVVVFGTVGGVYAVIGVLVLIGLARDRQWRAHSPNGKYPLAWWMVSIIGMLMIATFWPLALWLDSTWSDLDVQGYEET
jgi:hypothetical protein